MNIVVHPKYMYMKHDFMRIVQGNYVSEKVFCNKRNVVEKITLSGKKFVVKKFKRPTLANCFIYTFFRKSKARRAYENALLLLEKDIVTPFPVAYMEIKKSGFFHTGILVTEYMELPTMAEIKPDGNILSNDELKILIDDFIKFTILLNDKEIMPLDYNPGNLFYYKNDKTGHYGFALTDINRMRFGRFLRNRTAVRGFEQFGINTEHLYDFMLRYSEVKDADVDLCMYYFLGFRLRSKWQRKLKGKIKKVLLSF